MSHAYVTDGDRLFRVGVRPDHPDIVVLTATDLSMPGRPLLWTADLHATGPVDSVRLIRQSESLCVEVEVIAQKSGNTHTAVWVYRDDGQCTWQG